MSGSPSNAPALPKKLQVPPTTDLKQSSAHAAIVIVYGELQSKPAIPHQELFEMLVECLPPDLMLDANVLCNVPLYQAARELLRMLGRTTPTAERVPPRKAVITLLYEQYTANQRAAFMSTYETLTSLSRGPVSSAVSSAPPPGARGIQDASRADESRAIANSRKAAECFA
jgi:hypothetical protein